MNKYDYYIMTERYLVYMTTGELIVLILSSGVVTAMITSGKDIILAKFKRKNQVEDRDAEQNTDIAELKQSVKEIKEQIADLSKEMHTYMTEHNSVAADIIKSNKLIMQDKIEHLAMRFIRDGEVTYENRKMIHEMWHEYHFTWKGNGDLDILMEKVDQLPLKQL